MKRRRWRLVGLILLGQAAALAALVVLIIRSKGPAPEQVERQIRADVPSGTTWSAVEDYLRGRGIRFAACDYKPLDWVVEKARLGDREVRAFIQATVKPAFVSLLWEGWVTVYFLFDREDRLIGYAFSPFASAL